MTGLDRIDGFEGNGVKICIVDTGIDMSHPDLENANIIGWNDLISGSDSPYDDEGHGTAMAGIIASKGGLNGVSPEADLLIAKAISDDGSGTDTTIADAVDWCVDGGADIISLSPRRKSGLWLWILYYGPIRGFCTGRDRFGCLCCGGRWK